MIGIKGISRKSRDWLSFKVRIIPYLSDLLIVAWVLSEKQFFAYLCAKLISLSIPLPLIILDLRLGKRLAHLAKEKLQSPFRAAAARVNLSYLMVAGALAIIAMSIGHFVSGQFLKIDASFDEIVMWLVIAQSTAVLFGATTLLMTSVGQRQLCDLLRLITTFMFLCSVWIFGPEEGVLIAQMLAIAQITHAGICAIFLIKNGVWPGLTALFHKEIRVFS